MAVVVCDHCQADMPAKIKKQKLPDNVLRHFIKCPKCKTTYTGYYTDLEIRKLQSRQRVLRNDSTLALSDEEKVEEFEGNQKLLKQKMATLRQRIENSY